MTGTIPNHFSYSFLITQAVGIWKNYPSVGILRSTHGMSFYGEHGKFSFVTHVTPPHLDQYNITCTCGCGLPMWIFLPCCEFRRLCINSWCSSLSKFSCLCNSSVAPNDLRSCSTGLLVSNNLPNVALNSFDTKFGTWIIDWIFTKFTLHRIPDNWNRRNNLIREIQSNLC